MLAAVGPMLRLDGEMLSQVLEEHRDLAQSYENELEEKNNLLYQTFIEEAAAAYIVDKAAELGCVCSARVECRAGEDGLYLPIRAEVAGALAEPARTLLARRIA